MKKVVQLLCAILVLLSASSVFAVPNTGQYSVDVNVTQIDFDSYFFEYNITNNNQQISGTMTGLDGFFLQVPETAVISNVTAPASYYGWPGYWINTAGESPEWLNVPEVSLPAGNSWIGFWGCDPASVYPAGSTATFSFQADGVSVGTTTGVMASYWGGYTPSEDYVQIGAGNYSGFSSNMTGAVAPVPEPLTLSLMSLGLVGIAGLKKKNNN